MAQSGDLLERPGARHARPRPRHRAARLARHRREAAAQPALRRAAPPPPREVSDPPLLRHESVRRQAEAPGRRAGVRSGRAGARSKRAEARGRRAGVPAERGSARRATAHQRRHWTRPHRLAAAPSRARLLVSVRWTLAGQLPESSAVQDDEVVRERCRLARVAPDASARAADDY